MRYPEHHHLLLGRHQTTPHPSWCCGTMISVDALRTCSNETIPMRRRTCLSNEWYFLALKCHYADRHYIRTMRRKREKRQRMKVGSHQSQRAVGPVSDLSWVIHPGRRIHFLRKLQNFCIVNENSYSRQFVVYDTQQLS